MAESATFTGFDPYKLTGVRVTDRELGRGSYATVLELEYMGLKCAGKKIHELLEQGDASYSVRRFEEECRLLSQVRHPNIVQFLGVYFQQGVRAPILVMEFLPTNLTSCIEQYGILRKEISYSILHDVALGLCYLHSQTPAVIHRDLSSNNVLLTPNMTAKISDLGVARILNLTPLQVSRMTKAPGTLAYMPPEVMVANPKYDTSIDTFSYGIMMIHMFSGRWPEPQVEQIRNESGRMIPVSEAERRDVFLTTIGRDHPLMDVILRCINNDAKRRICAKGIVKHIKQQLPASSANRLRIDDLIEMQDQMEEMSTLREEFAQQNLELKQLQLLARKSDSQDQQEKAENEAKIKGLEEKTKLDENFITALQQEKIQLEQHLTLKWEKLEKELKQEKDACTMLKTENYDLLTKVRDLQRQVSSLVHDIKARDNAILVKDDIIQSKTRALNDNRAILSKMSEQLTRARKYLIDKQQVLLTTFNWKECAEIPARLSQGKTAVTINDKIYYGGVKSGDNYLSMIFCYNPSQDKWTTLPPIPVSQFGLGKVNGKLVAVGGQKSYDTITNDVYSFDEQSRKWEQTIPPMPIAKYSPGVSSLQSALVVAGGITTIEDSESASLLVPFFVRYRSSRYVEIFKPDTSQWYRTDPLPRLCCNISLVAIGDTCYALGGSNRTLEYFNQALYASVDDLLRNAVPANHTIHRGSSDTQSAWKTLPNTPSYGPAAAVLAGNLLAIGGDRRDIYLYCSLTESWAHIGILPCNSKDFDSTTALLSSLDIFVIANGGNSVYKGTPSLFMCKQTLT